MGSRFHVRYVYLLSLILFSTLILDSSCALKIPLEIAETDEQQELEINEFLNLVDNLLRFLGCHSIIAYTGNFNLQPSLEQLLMERLTIPIYTVVSNKGPLNRRYLEAETLVVVMISGLDDPTLGAVNDTELAYSGKQSYAFFFTKPLTMEMMIKFFNWCWERKFIRALAAFQGEAEFEVWSYCKLETLMVTRLSNSRSVVDSFRSYGYKFRVQVANDLPSIFWYNSSEQADVIDSGNISLSGPTGILIVEFMRYLNATMDILPVPVSQNSDYEFLEVGSNRTIDMVANLVANNSLFFSPIVTDTQTCLLVPNRRKISISRYFDQVADSGVYYTGLAAFLIVFVIKSIAHRRRPLVDSIFGAFRFIFGIPLPGGHLARLPLADKIIEVYCFLWVGIYLSTYVSILSSALTTGIHYPPIMDVQSMRASGLRIKTADRTIQKAFKNNEMPSSLYELVDLVDDKMLKQSFLDLNESIVHVIPTHNWHGLRLYQDRLKIKRFSISGPKLCSKTRHLRLPISPNTPLIHIFNDYFNMIIESGLQQKWLLMGFQKFREHFRIDKLPLDSEKEFQPLTLSFYTMFIKIYIGGMLLSTFVFVIEIFYKRYQG